MLLRSVAQPLPSTRARTDVSSDSTRGAHKNGHTRFAGSRGIQHDDCPVRPRTIGERANGRREVLGAAAAALQLFAYGSRTDLGGENLAAFSAGHDAGVAGNYDRAGVACERLLLRGVLGGDSDPELHFERGVEPAAVGHLGGRDAICDSL